MRGRSRSKNGVASLAYAPRIHAAYPLHGLPGASAAKTALRAFCPAMTN
jgi:hypothetical protein